MLSEKKGKSYYLYDLGKVLVAGPEHGWVVALHQIAEVPVDVGRLVHVLVDGQPGEPHGQVLVQVNLAGVELEDLGRGRDCVLRRVDVLRLAGTRSLVGHVKFQLRSNFLYYIGTVGHGQLDQVLTHLYDLDQLRQGRRADGGKAGPAKLPEHPAAVGGGLPHLRLGVGDVVQHGLHEVLLVLGRGRPEVLDDVVEDAEPPLVVGPRVGAVQQADHAGEQLVEYRGQGVLVGREEGVDEVAQLGQDVHVLIVLLLQLLLHVSVVVLVRALVVPLALALKVLLRKGWEEGSDVKW